MKINCIIVDDSPLAVDKLKGFIKEFPALNLMQSFQYGKEALSFMQMYPVDLVFLDIQMEDITGIEVLEQLALKPSIVIVSAYAEYAVQGFDYSVTDYLLKPYSFLRFKQAIEKVIIERADKPTRDYIFVKSEYRMERINFADILYIEGQGGYLKIVTNKARIMTLQNFQNMEALLPDTHFMRVHKSYIIALNKIEQIERNVIRIDKDRIPIGGSYREKLFRELKIKD